MILKSVRTLQLFTLVMIFWKSFQTPCVAHCATNAFHTNHFYQVLNSHSSKRINKVTVNGDNFVVYDYNKSYHALADMCPHQGASLSRGRVNHRGNIHCPYHAFEFDRDGHFVGIPDPSRCPREHDAISQRRRTATNSFDTFHFEGDVFLCPSRDKHSPLDLPYYPPEHFNDDFVHTSQSIVIDQDYRVVTENVLDMLHISYIHSFGNKNMPLPSYISYQKLDESSGRSTFRYVPNEMTISNIVGDSPTVVVENEYHLPTTTVTRVIAGDLVKTVLTRSTPLSENKTLFFWRIYRNFWTFKNFPMLNMVGDMVMNTLMGLTLREDRDILRHVYPEGRNGSLRTKYDVTIQNYRKCLEKNNIIV